LAASFPVAIFAVRWRLEPMPISVSHQDLPAWIGLRRQGDGRFDLGQIKAELGKRGVNARGWRLYLDYGDALFSPLRGPWIEDCAGYNNLIFSVIWLRLLQQCEMDVPPPPELAYSMRDWDFPGNGFGHTPPLFLRAAWKACLAAAFSGANLGSFVHEEIVPIARWFFASGAFRQVDGGQLKAGWNTICRLYEDWQWEHNPEYERDEWHPFARFVEWKSVRFLALTCQAALEAESRAMHHCIETYSDRCRQGEIRVYSVRDRSTGKRLATATVEHSQYRGVECWTLGDVKGHWNAPVSRDVLEAAEALDRCYQDLPADFFKSYFIAQAALSKINPPRDSEEEERWFDEAYF
jgi:hypothetical protein